MRWKGLLLFWFLVIASGVLMLAFFQHRMIYHPRPYNSYYQNYVESGIQKITYQTREGSQTAFYWPPVGGKHPEMLWLLFGGNAALALDWMWLIEKASAPGIGFLLIDYPGFGKCEGRASPETILASSQMALEQWLKDHAGDVKPQLGIMGHSLGTGAGLQLAGKIPLRKVLLLSPFTSFADMVRRMFGSWLVPLLLHRFENKEPIQNLLKQKAPPEIVIIHGTRDEVIPVEMGRELAALDKQKIEYIELPNSGHNTIIQDAFTKILSELKGN